ncbi:MAG: transporter substrate-binding domain-containing protein, partial [Burkholderiaceae bacterium]
MSLQRRSLFALALVAVVFAPVSRAQSALDAIAAKKSVAIAIPTDFPPYGFVGTDMAPQGLDVDMARLIAARLGATVELVPVTSANR